MISTKNVCAYQEEPQRKTGVQKCQIISKLLEDNAN